MKALILSCNTGQGHNTAGKAIMESMHSRGIECELVDTLLFASEKASRKVSGTYDGITTKTPRVLGFLYWLGEVFSSSKRKYVIYLANRGYADPLGRYIDEHGIGVVITCHLFPGEALTRLRRKNRLGVKTFAVITDYSCSPFWEETELDYYFIPHQGLADEFVKRGIPKEKLVATGIPVSKQFCSR